jgi:toxin CcdB
MPQFTIYKNINENTKDACPYLLDVQNDLLEGLNTRVVIPMSPSSKIGKKPIGNLTPQFEIKGTLHTLLTPQLAGIAVADLGPVAGDLSEFRPEIIRALDFLFTGY